MLSDVDGHTPINDQPNWPSEERENSLLRNAADVPARASTVHQLKAPGLPAAGPRRAVLVRRMQTQFEEQGRIGDVQTVDNHREAARRGG